ncbi:MAG: SMC-Scp complex subunit ScpB [Methanomassiliicoccales archaeon]|nr:MAG: SMC-Scp complex subunit ScpB [Methanomassiliicoccales archaeon]
MKSERIVEASLFSAGRPLKVSEIAAATGIGSDTIRKTLKKLISEYEDRDTAIEVARVSGKYVMQIKESYSSPADMLAKTEVPKKYLKTASLIAYHQPIKQSDLVEMVGGKGYEHVKALKELGLISTKPYGATKVLRTTKKFLEHFGIDAKRPDEIKKFLAEKIGAK